MTGPDGEFKIDGLEDGKVNLFVLGKGEGDVWTFCADEDIDLQPGLSRVLAIELIPGVEVSGSVVTEEGKPVEGASVAAQGPRWPGGGTPRGSETDARGRFRYRLPPGETYFYVENAADHFIPLPDKGSSQTVQVPEGVATIEVSPIKVAASVVLHGRVVDANDKPVPLATIVGVMRFDRALMRSITPAGRADAKGVFHLAGQNHAAPVGKPVKLLVRTVDEREFDIEVTPAADGEVTVKLPE